MIELWVDFNNTDGAGNVMTLRKYATSELHVGESVVVGDGDGDKCEAVVVAVDDRFVVVSLVPGTFDSEESRQHVTA